MMTSLTGTGILLRLAWRRDRILIPVSALALIALAVGSAKATLALYPTAESAKTGAADLLNNPSVLALYGPVSDASNPDSLAVFKTILLGAVFLGLLCCGIVRRHTRSEEEDGRFELVGAGVVGRAAPLAAAVILSLLAALLTVIGSAAGMIGLGMDVTGTLAFTVAWLVAALFMTGTTAVAAQLTTTTRGCSAIALSVLGVAYLLRAVGDTANSSAGKALSWVSPLGWSEKVSAYGHNAFWVGLLGLAYAAATLAGAVALLHHRDLGAGLLPSRPGPANASRWLGSPIALALRLQRGQLIGWTIAFAVAGSVVGSLAKSAEQMLDNDSVKEMLTKLGGSAGSLLDIFFATELKFAAAAAAAAGVAGVARLRSEESALRTEQVLATSVSRPRWLAAYAVPALVVPAWLMAVIGLTAAATSRSAADAPSAGAIVGAALAVLPAVWLVIAAALALYGVLPRWTAAGWAVLAIAFGLGEFGPIMNAPHWLVGISPFDHLGQLPGGDAATSGLVTLSVLAIVLIGLGFVGFRRRDLQP